MTALRESAARERHENAHSALPKRTWVFIAAICILSSLSFQFIAPFIQLLLTNSLICLNPVVNDDIKKIFKCIGVSSQQKTLKKSHGLQKVTYFDEPFPIEPWLNEEETYETCKALS